LISQTHKNLLSDGHLPIIVFLFTSLTSKKGWEAVFIRNYKRDALDFKLAKIVRKIWTWH